MTTLQTRSVPEGGPGRVQPVPLRTVMQLVTPGARARRSKRLLVYLHAPFCSSKCHFCDWVVGYDKTDLIDAGDLRQRYVQAICTQLRSYGPRLSELGYAVTNIYWGGGTPTRLTPEQLTQVRGALGEVFDLSSVSEHTAECSPETVTAEHLEALLDGGLNRISVGVQSLDDGVLRRMGRAHDSQRALDALDLFRRMGIRNFNIDLITGFSQQSRQVVMDSVRRTIDLGVPHVSLYMFREFSTQLVAVRQIRVGWRDLASRAERAAIYLAAKELLEAAGYEEYMVGYFALDPRFHFDGESYYFGLMGDYFGFGAGASSTVGRCSLRSGDADRYGGARVRAFVEQPTPMLAAPLAVMPDSIYLNVYLKAFATRDGILFDRWMDQFGFSFQSFLAARPAIRTWFQEQEAEGARFTTTKKGIALTQDTWVQTMMWRR